MKPLFILSIIFLSVFSMRAQELKIAGKWWSIRYSNGYERQGDTLIFIAKDKEIAAGIYFSNGGDYKKMIGWEYCGTYVHQHHLKENPPIYENGKWNLIKKDEKTFLYLDAKSRQVKYRVLSAPGDSLYLVVTGN